MPVFQIKDNDGVIKNTIIADSKDSLDSIVEQDDTIEELTPPPALPVAIYTYNTVLWLMIKN